MNRSIIVAGQSSMVSEAISAELSRQPDTFVVLASQLAADTKETTQNSDEPCILFFGGHGLRSMKAEFKQLARLQADYPKSGCLLLVPNFDTATVANLSGSHARGLLSTGEAHIESLLSVIDIVANGGTFISDNASEAALEYLCNDKLALREASLLTEREKQVTNLIANGLSSKEIARVLALSPATVNVHRKNIMTKLGVKKATELVQLAMTGII